MADEVVLNKVAVIERCLKRITEEYEDQEDELETDYTRQDAIVLNLLRASEATIDLAMHATRAGELGLPQETREAFVLLERAGKINLELSRRMQAMVGFRNITVHDYQNLNLEVVKSILENHLDDFRTFSKVMLEQGGEKLRETLNSSRLLIPLHQNPTEFSKPATSPTSSPCSRTSICSGWWVTNASVTFACWGGFRSSQA